MNENPTPVVGSLLPRMSSLTLSYTSQFDVQGGLRELWKLPLRPKQTGPSSREHMLADYSKQKGNEQKKKHLQKDGNEHTEEATVSTLSPLPLPGLLEGQHGVILRS